MLINKEETLPESVPTSRATSEKQSRYSNIREQETFKIALTSSPFLKQLSVIEFEKRTEKEEKRKQKSIYLTTAQLRRVRRSSDISASACCKAGPSSNPGSAPQGDLPLSEEQ
jgi:hypothetical protein